MGFRAGASRRAKRAILWMLLMAAVVPAAASAEASSNIRRSPGDSAAFTLGGSNGYSLYFKSEKGLLTIIASQRRPTQPTIAASGKLVPGRVGSATESTYTVRGVSRDPRTIDADLGAAGKVSLSFQPSGKRKVTPIDLSDKTEKCIGAAKIVRRLGSFVGSVSFHGENGYTDAEAVSVPGTFGTSTFRNCSQAPEHPPAEEELPDRPTVLSVNGEVGFFGLRDADESRFFAFMSEELGSGLSVFRLATAVAEPSLFSATRDGRRARLRPPAPFSGTGIYADTAAAAPTWSGDLSVSFPGVQKPLTGEGFFKPLLRLGSRQGG